MPLRSGSSIGDSASTSRTLPRGSGWTTDDVVIAHIYVEDISLTIAAVDSVSGNPYDPATPAIDQIIETIDFRTRVFCRRLTSADTGGVAFTWGGVSVWNVVIGGAYSGRLLSGDPQDAAATTNTNATNNATLTARELTPAHADADIVIFGANFEGGSHASWSSGATEQVDFGGSAMADFTHTSGATGDVTATVTSFGGSTAWIAVMAALRAEGSAADVLPVEQSQVFPKFLLRRLGRT